MTHSSDPAPTHGLWAGLHDPSLAPKEADFSVVGIPYDAAASARRGARQAPERIRFWSQHLTPFAEDRTPLRSIRIRDIGDLQVVEQELDFDAIQKRISELENTPIVLGGDHSISIPVLRGQRDRHPGKRLGLLWLDAHPDLCDEFTGSRLSHACVLRRGLEAGIQFEDVCMVGLRSWEEQEIEFLRDRDGHIHTSAWVAEHGAKAAAEAARQVLERCDAIHISLDIDCLDPSAAPGTGIPDAAGLSSRDLLRLIQSLEGLPLVGLDVVEVAPAVDPSESTVLAALKFIMEFIALRARQRSPEVRHGN